MRFWILYHNYDKLGRLPGKCGFVEVPHLADIDTSDFDASCVSTRKADILDAVGDIAFMIVGRGTNPKEYVLWSWHVIDEIEGDKTSGFDAFGPGRVLNPPVRLAGEHFDAFKKFAGNFGLGFQNITDHPFVEELLHACKQDDGEILDYLSVSVLEAAAIYEVNYLEVRFTGHPMRDYVSYHNEERMGYSFEDSNTFAVATSKPVSRLVGAKVWCIAGAGRPRKYALGSWFIVDTLGTHGGEGFGEYVSGEVGVDFEPMIPLNQLDWFPRFLKSQSNFSLGLQPIRNEFVPLFEAVVAESGQGSSSEVDIVFGGVERRLQQIKIRRGQPAFRQLLIEAYGGRCAVSDCSVVALLDGAHIVPVKESGRFQASNGLLLRTDIHTLFDLGLMRIRPAERTIEIADELLGTEYEHLRGMRIREPSTNELRPRQEFLDIRWKLHQRQLE